MFKNTKKYSVLSYICKTLTSSERLRLQNVNSLPHLGKSGNVSFKSKVSVKMKYSLSMKESTGIRSVKSRLRTNSKRNFKSSREAASMPNIYSKFSYFCPLHSKKSLKYLHLFNI